MRDNGLSGFGRWTDQTPGTLLAAAKSPDTASTPPALQVDVKGDDTDEKRALAATVKQAINRAWPVLTEYRSEFQAAGERIRRAIETGLKMEPDATRKMLGLENVAVETLLGEVAGPFAPAEPPHCILLDLTEDEREPGSPVPMAADLGPEIIHIYCVPFRITYKDQVEDFALHEMIHLCREALYAQDGIVRPNAIGVAAIRHVLEMHGL
jgi:hypothetical protein